MASASASSSTSASTTYMPAFDQRRANARPIPLPAPVTTAVLPPHAHAWSDASVTTRSAALQRSWADRLAARGASFAPEPSGKARIPPQQARSTRSSAGLSLPNQPAASDSVGVTRQAEPKELSLEFCQRVRKGRLHRRPPRPSQGQRRPHPHSHRQTRLQPLRLLLYPATPLAQRSPPASPTTSPAGSATYPVRLVPLLQTGPLRDTARN